MRTLPIVGILLLILGILAFIVPVPHRERHGVRFGDANISFQTEESERLPPALGILLVGGGLVALIVGLRRA